MAAVPLFTVVGKVADALISPVSIVTTVGATEATVRLDDVRETAMGEGARDGLPAESVSHTTTLPELERTALPGSAVTLSEYGGDPTTPTEVVPALNPVAVAVTN